tara:strand:- start:267 stop:527 length:261 start_codon:yes stop_codon:yes gene_type:complete
MSTKEKQPMLSATRKGRALGRVSQVDRPQASKAMGGGGAGSKGGMTLTRVTGLGACMVQDLDEVIVRAKAQYKADRRAMVLEGSAT